MPYMPLKSLYGKLAVVLMAVFFAIGVVFVLGTERMLEARRLLELGTYLVIGAIAFSLVAALIVFNLLTRRLRLLAAAMDEFRATGFARPTRNIAADPDGDEIDRLAIAFQEMSVRMADQLRMLERNEAQRSELLANVSHDLRTPLASMQGYLETLLLKHGTLSAEEARSYLEVAAKHSERLGRLVRDLFDLTKLEANAMPINQEVFPLTELVQDVVQKFQLSAQKRHIRLTHDLQPDAPPVFADIGMIERVLENLIENALRHTPPDGTVRVAVEAAAERVRLEVIDTGRGIPQAEIANIVERYYRIDRGEFGGEGGVGLGLAITRRVVELHGGHLEVDSRVAEGSTFRFDLPAAAGGNAPALAA